MRKKYLYRMEFCFTLSWKNPVYSFIEKCFTGILGSTVICMHFEHLCLKLVLASYYEYIYNKSASKRLQPCHSFIKKALVCQVSLKYNDPGQLPGHPDEKCEQGFERIFALNPDFHELILAKWGVSWFSHIRRKDY